jgi:hypothetical protein
MIKRESGENPEQSRCCNARRSLFRESDAESVIHTPLNMLWEGNHGKLSQKTCQPIFLL